MADVIIIEREKEENEQWLDKLCPEISLEC